MNRTVSIDEAETPLALSKSKPDSTEIEEFIYLISHDVRNSVRALIELPQWIVEDLEEAGVKVDGAVAENIDLMNRHTGRLDRMLVDLLTFSRVGRMQKIETVDLNAALDDVLEDVRIPAGFEVLRELECIEAKMGERDVLTLLTVLISNAVKHHDAAKGRIKVSCRRDGAQVVLSVCDDGPGIPMAYRDRVFGVMTTLKPRDEVEGSGMGLAIARKIAKIYDGDAKVIENENGAGVTFQVNMVA